MNMSMLILCMIFGVGTVIIAAGWTMMSFGQRIYSFIFMGLVALSCTYVQFEDKQSGANRWAFAWENPVYVDKEAGDRFSDEDIEHTRKTNPQLADHLETMNGPVKRHMTRVYFKRSFNHLFLLVAIAGFYFVPRLFDTMLFNYAQKQRAKEREFQFPGRH